MEDSVSVVETPVRTLGSCLRTKVQGSLDWYIEQGPQDLLRERFLA